MVGVLFFFSWPRAGLTNRVPVRDSRAGAPLGETLSISSELDVAFEIDLVEIPDEPWDDNDSDSDAGVDSETSEDEL